MDLASRDLVNDLEALSKLIHAQKLTRSFSSPIVENFDMEPPAQFLLWTRQESIKRFILTSVVQPMLEALFPEIKTTDVKIQSNVSYCLCPK